MAERIISLSEVPTPFRRNEKWVKMAERAMSLEKGKAIAAEIEAKEHASARQALSQLKKRRGGVNYTLRKGVLYLYSVESVSPKNPSAGSRKKNRTEGKP